jgi:hypothetical protein
VLPIAADASAAAASAAAAVAVGVAAVTACHYNVLRCPTYRVIVCAYSPVGSRRTC